MMRIGLLYVREGVDFNRESQFLSVLPLTNSFTLPNFLNMKTATFGQYAKRTMLFLLTNVLVVISISVILNLLNVNHYVGPYGLDLKSLAIFSLVWGMAGSLISLMLSRIMAKLMMGVQVIDPKTRDSNEQVLIEMVYRLSRQAKLPKMPEVGIYESYDVNAFATGPSKSRALVAVSSGLLAKMNRTELEGVLAHEVSHIANGDMVTMTLLQGIVNAFAMFMSRLLAWAISQAFRDRDRESGSGSGLGIGGFFLQMAIEMVFLMLGSIVVAAFSRYREFRADHGGARLAGTDSMIAALTKLKTQFDHTEEEEPGAQGAIQALRISNKGSFLSLFSTHPALEVRIERLEQNRYSR